MQWTSSMKPTFMARDESPRLSVVETRHVVYTTAGLTGTLFTRYPGDGLPITSNDN